MLVNKEVVKEATDCEKVDNWIWKEGDSRRYTVKYAYVILRRELQGEDSLIFEQFWKIKSIPLHKNCLESVTKGFSNKG